MINQTGLIQSEKDCNQKTRQHNFLLGLYVLLRVKRKEKRETWCKDWPVRRDVYTHKNSNEELTSESSDN